MLRRLQIHGLRSITRAEFRFSPGLNALIGPNGAGKTSILEALHLLSRGRSFRPGSPESLVQRGAPEMVLMAEMEAAGRTEPMALRRRDGRWTLRIDGDDQPGLKGLPGRCDLVCFEPGTHSLIHGGGDGRRQFLDWGVFHMEHDVLEPLRRYRRALRQRNSLLRRSATDAELVPWEHELGQCASVIAPQRQAYMRRFQQALRREMDQLAPELGALSVQYQQGWSADAPLDHALWQRRDRDRERGHTTCGLHRADWMVAFEKVPQREQLSRGQEKAVALGCVLAQAELYAKDQQNQWPIVCIDDLASELDSGHQRQLVDRLAASNAQTLVTGTEVPEALAAENPTVFHVEP